jgi:hypothetical protein
MGNGAMVLPQGLPWGNFGKTTASQGIYKQQQNKTNSR